MDSRRLDGDIHRGPIRWRGEISVFARVWLWNRLGKDVAEFSDCCSALVSSARNH